MQMAQATLELEAGDIIPASELPPGHLPRWATPRSRQPTTLPRSSLPAGLECSSGQGAELPVPVPGCILKCTASAFGALIGAA